MIRPLACFSAALALLVGASCIPDEPDNDRIINWSEDTVMGEVQERGVLVAGVPADQAPFSHRTDQGPEGFLVEVAGWIAEELGVELELRAGPMDELLALADSGQVDVALPNLGITEQRVRSNIAFTNPYYVGHQRLLVPVGSGIDGVGDLSGARVCQLIDEDTGVDIQEVADDVAVLSAGKPDRCAKALVRGAARAVTASDLFLVQVLHGLRAGPTCPPRSNCDGEIVGDQLTTTGYGAVVEPGSSGWADFIDTTFAEAELEGRWAAAYERWIAPFYGGHVPPPPDLTAEEAAALYPQGI